MSTINNNVCTSAFRYSILASIIGLILGISACKEEAVTQSNTSSDVTAKTEPTPASTVQEISDKTNKFVDEIGTKVNDAQANIKDLNNDTFSNSKLANGNSVFTISDIYVVDGDTIHAVDQSGNKLKIRLTGIDAPESTQALGEESTESLRGCVGFNENALVTVMPNNSKDKYGRTLGKVESAEIDCNMQQLEKGMAVFYKEYADKLDSDDAVNYGKSEEYARVNQFGLWSGVFQNPAEYREQNR